MSTLALVGGAHDGKVIDAPVGCTRIVAPVLAPSGRILGHVYDAMTGQWQGVDVDYQEQPETDMAVVERWSWGAPHRPSRQDLLLIEWALERPARIRASVTGRPAGTYRKAPR